MLKRSRTSNDARFARINTDYTIVVTPSAKYSVCSLALLLYVTRVSHILKEIKETKIEVRDV